MPKTFEENPAGVNSEEASVEEIEKLKERSELTFVEVLCLMQTQEPSFGLDYLPHPTVVKP